MLNPKTNLMLIFLRPRLTYEISRQIGLAMVPKTLAQDANVCVALTAAATGAPHASGLPVGSPIWEFQQLQEKLTQKSFQVTYPVLSNDILEYDKVGLELDKAFNTHKDNTRERQGGMCMARVHGITKYPRGRHRNLH